jgi:hypothetical protein
MQRWRHSKARICTPLAEPASAQPLVTANFSSPARKPFASLSASSLAQKCTKNRRGCSSSMWLWMAVTSIPFRRSARRSGFTSPAVSTKSPVMAALPPPVAWKLMAMAFEKARPTRNE